MYLIPNDFFFFLLIKPCLHYTLVDIKYLVFEFVSVRASGWVGLGCCCDAILKSRVFYFYFEHKLEQVQV